MLDLVADNEALMILEPRREIGISQRSILPAKRALPVLHFGGRRGTSGLNASLTTRWISRAVIQVPPTHHRYVSM